MTVILYFVFDLKLHYAVHITHLAWKKYMFLHYLECGDFLQPIFDRNGIIINAPYNVFNDWAIKEITDIDRSSM